MAGIVIRFVVTFVAVFLTTLILPRIGLSLEFPDLTTMAIFSVVLALLNAFVRPVLSLLTCPLQVMTLGLFSLVLNAVMFLIAAWLVTGTPEINFLTALVAALIVSIISTILSQLVE